MKLSARNQLAGVITAIKKGAVNAEIDLKLEGGAEVSAVITLASVQKLGLKVGKKATAIIKANEVMVGTGKSLKLSARNVIPATVKEIVPGVVNAEIILTSGKTEIVSVITQESVKKLGLKVGKEAFAVIKASNVIVGV